MTFIISKGNVYQCGFWQNNLHCYRKEDPHKLWDVTFCNWSIDKYN